MQLFEELKIKFEEPLWFAHSELAVIDTILESHPEFIVIFSTDVMRDTKNSQYGRGDTPSVEQIVRFGIYKELRGLDYRELEFAQLDSRLCAEFTKIDPLRPYSFQVLQKYISKISKNSTIIESNIHYPTNNSLVWDCIHESHRLLTHLQEEVTELSFSDYTKSAKKTYYLINNSKSNLILACDILKGNPADSSLYQPMIEKVEKIYQKIPRDIVTDGGYASKANMEYAQNKGIKNVVFNKVVGSLKNLVSSKNMETRLKKWRSGTEAIISNLKRGFNLFRCNWKGEEHFAQKVLWSVIAYNIRVISGKLLSLM
jgi:hypothetical protein